MADYDDFAWFYNRYWNEEFHSVAFPILEPIWLSRLEPGARILDVCCGTGHLAGMLTDRGYRVTGIDASPAMIRHARENAPAAEFYVCDATQFHIPADFDAAVCTFDSLNHILSVEALEAVLRNTAAALKPGALFAFDLLSEAAYQTRWTDAFSIVRDDHVLAFGGEGYDFRTSTAHCEITMFRLLEGAWRRFDVVIHERCHRPEEVDAALLAAGFVGVRRHSGCELGMSGQLGQGRTFIVAARG
ncbi:MAG TPA: class I SAM-dependent methyltransferase [Bryobacteraceae bacterium]|jgi:SAM-dependent methyltransferase